MVVHMNSLRGFLRATQSWVFFQTLTDSTGYFKNSELRSFVDSTNLFDELESGLELGTFEGIASLYIAKFTKIQSIKTIDPFPDKDAGSNGVSSSTRSNFLRNYKVSPVKKKVFQLRMTSDSFFASNQDTFDFIYIDGSHEPTQVIRDLENSLKVLRPGGLMWIDDVKSDYEVNQVSLGQVIRNWILMNDSILYKIHDGYQVGLLKT